MWSYFWMHFRSIQPWCNRCTFSIPILWVISDGEVLRNRLGIIRVSRWHYFINWVTKHSLYTILERKFLNMLSFSECNVTGAVGSCRLPSQWASSIFDGGQPREMSVLFRLPYHSVIHERRALGYPFRVQVSRSGLACARVSWKETNRVANFLTMSIANKLYSRSSLKEDVSHSSLSLLAFPN